MKRKYAHKSTVMAMTMPASHKRSRGKVRPLMVTTFVGRIGGTTRGVGPNCSATSPWMAISRPIEATTLASTGALRRGRNTRVWTSSPISADEASPRVIAGKNPAPLPNNPKRCGMTTTGINRSPVRRNSS